MSKIVLLLLLPLVLLADTQSIDERQTDIYFANGIMNSRGDALKSLGLIYDEMARVIYGGDKIKMDKYLSILLTATLAVILAVNFTVNFEL